MKEKIVIIICLAFSVLRTNAQIVKIPDVNFKKELVELGVDKNKDGQISVDEAKLIDSLNLSNKGIKKMDGIENFTSIYYLSCDDNSIKKIDISKNILLERFSCENNLIKSIEIRKNQQLEGFFIRNNKIKTINLSGNSKLGFIDVGMNRLKSLDVRKNHQPLFLGCDNNPQLLFVCVTSKQLDFFNSVSSSNQKDSFTSWRVSCN